MHEKVQKSFFFAQIITSELVLINCPSEKQDNFHRQPMC